MRHIGAAVLFLLFSILASLSYASEDHGEFCFPPLVDYYDYWSGEKIEFYELDGQYELVSIEPFQDTSRGPEIFYRLFLSQFKKDTGVPPTIEYQHYGPMDPEVLEGMFEEQILP